MYNIVHRFIDMTNITNGGCDKHPPSTKRRGGYNV